MTALQYDTLPIHVKTILATYSAQWDESRSFEICKQLEAHLNSVFWDCDYDLAGEISDIYPITIMDDNGDLWERETDSQSGAYSWTCEEFPIPEDLIVWCTPFFEDMEGICFDLDRGNGDDTHYTFVELEDGMDVEDELKKLLATVKGKI
jgi:hypothetical protein